MKLKLDGRTGGLIAASNRASSRAPFSILVRMLDHPVAFRGRNLGRSRRQTRRKPQLPGEGVRGVNLEELSFDCGVVAQPALVRTPPRIFFAARLARNRSRANGRTPTMTSEMNPYLTAGSGAILQGRLMEGRIDNARMWPEHPKGKRKSTQRECLHPESQGTFRASVLSSKSFVSLNLFGQESLGE